MRTGIFLRACLAGATALAVSGCAAALLPVAAGGAILQQETGGAERTEDAAPARTDAALSDGGNPEPSTALATLPAQMTVADQRLLGGSYAPFARHALAAAGIPVSVLPDPDWRWDAQHTLPCDPAATPAVLIDLDPDGAAFDPVKAQLVAPGLGRVLAILREAGIVVFWSSMLPESREMVLRAALARTGLDPTGEDLLLLTRAPDEHKTMRRNAGVDGFCVVAIAGDARGDFDMLFDYLREREGLTPFESLFGRGWFTAPPALEN